MSKNLIARLAVAAIFIPVILWISYRGGSWLYGLTIFLSFMAIAEFLIAERFRPASLSFVTLALATILLVDLSIEGPASLLWGSLGFGEGKLTWLICIFLVSGMLFSVGKRPPGELFNQYARLIWGLLYVGLLYPFLFLVGNLDEAFQELPVSGGDSLLFLFALLWIGDTAAMYVGQTFGKHKLAPSVSPNKTVEGFFGGLIGALIVGIVMSFWKFDQFPMYQILIVAFFCSLAGQLGDLVESMWKRSLNIKDSSTIIPGHGGFLDRFDSLLFAAPVMYAFFVILMR